MVLVGRELAQITVDAAAGRVCDPRRARAPHRLDDVVGEQGSLVEVDRRLGCGTGDVGVGGQVQDHVVPTHSLGERVEVLDVAALDPEPVVVRVGLQVPLASGGEVVEDRHLLAVLEQPVDEVAAQKAGPTDDEIAAHGGDAGRAGGVGLTSPTPTWSGSGPVRGG
jgi:hypothetical protein